jgi:hypothetical protein
MPGPDWPQFADEAGSWPLPAGKARALSHESGAPVFPRAGWPDMPTVEYLTKLILLGLLLLALPYLLGRLVFHPGDVLEATAERAMRGPIPGA